MDEKFKVQFLEEAAEFLDQVDNKAREKIIYNIRKAQVTTRKELFKKLSGEIWEFRTLFKKTHYRFLAFWDKSKKSNTVVISTHGIVKKTSKVPQSEIDKAERIRKKYLKQKSHENI